MSPPLMVTAGVAVGRSSSLPAHVLEMLGTVSEDATVSAGQGSDSESHRPLCPLGTPILFISVLP